MIDYSMADLIRGLVRAREAQDHEATAVLRLALAERRGSGVRLTAEEVGALFADHAVYHAAENILEEVLDG